MARFIFITLFIIYSSITSFSQAHTTNQTKQEYIIESFVGFTDYAFSRNSDLNEAAIYFTLKVKNIGDVPIPNLGAIERSKFVDFIVNDSIQNPLSLYNGAGIAGDYTLSKGQEDAYTWWITNDTATFGEVFTVKWRYLNKFTEIYQVNIKTKTAEIVVK